MNNLNDPGKNITQIIYKRDKWKIVSFRFQLKWQKKLSVK